MAASPTPRPTPAEGPHPAAALLSALKPPLPVSVAYSGGADSTFLLHAAVLSWPGQVHAVHVHHGLQDAADDFARHCEAACFRLGVPLRVQHVHARHRAGESPEDAARAARYTALADAALAQGCGSVLLAQHADDQVETVLLALSRGAGLPGLAAMPERFERHGMLFLRPLLSMPGQAIRDWLLGRGVPSVDDPSNGNLAFTRNRIRHQLLPALAAAFPQYRDTVARSARHAAEAQSLLVELAAADLAAMGGVPDIARLQGWSRARQANLLRHWLRTAHGATGSAAQLGELLDQVAACTTRGHAIRIRVAGGRVEREGNYLLFRHSV